MQVCVEREGRRVRQHGESVGELEGCVVEDVSAQTLAAILAALPAHGGGVRLSGDHSTVEALPEPPAQRAVRARQEARAAAIERAREMAAAHPDPLLALLAQLLLEGGPP